MCANEQKADVSEGSRRYVCKYMVVHILFTGILTSKTTVTRYQKYQIDCQEALRALE